MRERSRGRRRRRSTRERKELAGPGTAQQATRRKQIIARGPARTMYLFELTFGRRRRESARGRPTATRKLYKFRVAVVVGLDCERIVVVVERNTSVPFRTRLNYGLQIKKRETTTTTGRAAAADRHWKPQPAAPKKIDALRGQVSSPERAERMSADDQ